MRIHYLTLVCSVLLFAFSRATAQESTVTTTSEATTETMVEEETESPWSLSGAVDGYYMYNFNESGFPTSFTGEHNAFTLGMAQVTLAREGKVGFVADLAFGPRAQVANGLVEDLPTLSAIKQLYVTYSPTDAVTFTFGNFGTFIGYELIDAPGNVNYTTSYLFSNGPFYHTGLKADIALGEKFGAMVGIFNDTDNKFDPTPGKHFGAQLSTELGGLSLYLNGLVGKVDDGEDPESKDDNVSESVIDLTASYGVSDALSLGLNVASRTFSMDGTTTGGYLGTALYATITASEAFALGLRGEYFALKDGDDNLDDNNVIALTASGNITIGNLRLIPEFRYDFSNSDTFFEKYENGELTELSAGMGGVILAAVYSF